MTDIKIKRPSVMKEDERKETPKQEKAESSLTEVAEFIDCILTGAVIAHKMHLRETGPGSYAAHKALNELYDALPEHGDSIAETYQGYHGVIIPQVDSVDLAEYLAMKHTEYVKYLLTYVEDYRKCLGTTTAIQNLVDELVGTLSGVHYKLKFLE